MISIPADLSSPAAPCPKCGAERTLRKNNGVRCRPCSNRQLAAWRAAHPERAREYAAKRRANAGGAAALNKQWESRNPEKARAHRVVETRLLSGAMTKQPCERCGATDLVHAHHDDYSKPLEVMWLCPLHHKERHRELQFREAAE